MLGFKANCASTRECCSQLSLVSVSPIIRVYLNSRFGGINFHCTAGNRLVYFSCKTQFAYFSLVEDEAMVVTGAILRLFVIGIYAFADFTRGRKIKRSAFYRFDFSRRNRGVVNRNEIISINLTLQFFNSWSGVGNTGQTEEPVISHIDDGCFVGCPFVFDDQFIVVGERISDIHV